MQRCFLPLFCDVFSFNANTNVSGAQKLKQLKDKKKHKAVIKDKRKKGLLPAKKEESEEEEWENDEEEDDEEDESEDEEAENGLFDMEAEESDGDESDDEEIGGVRLLSLLLCSNPDSLADFITPDHISSSPSQRERYRFRIRG